MTFGCGLLCLGMGNWDDIYKAYQEGGDAWATLSEEIDSRFITLIEKGNFPKKRALDIGCGTGKYLAFLETQGFTVTGIDSSPTAVEMTKKLVSSKADITCVDMYSYDYPPSTYDLVLSISSLHHGYKKQIESAIAKVYRSLVEGAIAFITLPDLPSSTKWQTFQDHIKLEEGTYAPKQGPETGLPHSFYTEQEIRTLFSGFESVQIDLDDIGRWFVTARK